MGNKYSSKDLFQIPFVQFNSLELKFVSESKFTRTRRRNLLVGITSITLVVLSALTVYAQISQRKVERTQKELVGKIIENGITSANALINEGEYQQAISVLKTTSQLPGIQSRNLDSLIEAWLPLPSLMGIADSLQNEKEYNEAVACYQKALTIIPGDRRITEKIIQTEESLHSKFLDLKKKGIGFMTFEEFSYAISRFEEALKIEDDKELRLLLDSCINELRK